MINIALHDPIDIIRFILPIIPSLVIFFSVLLQEYHQHKHIGYAVLCILLGFTFFPSNEYVSMTVGIFVCCIIYLNYERVHKGKLNKTMIKDISTKDIKRFPIIL